MHDYGIVYSYYASQTPLNYGPVYSLSTHQVWYYKQHIGVPIYSPDSLTMLATTFYTNNSGLTPASSYSTKQHVDAYYTNLLLNSTWKDLLKANTYELLGLNVVSNTFTATFGANF